MHNWVKIQSFDRMHQALLRKDILEKNGIQAYIVNARDSLFLIGEIDLYVPAQLEAKAHAMIDEFEGLTKVNSFVNEKPMQLFFDILTQNGIAAVLIQKEDSRFVLDNFEVYVPNEQVNDAIPFLTGEKLSGWKKITICHQVSQTKYRVDLLEESSIECIIIKKRDSDFHTEEVGIFVKETVADKALQILTTLNGWVSVNTFDTMSNALINEDLLKSNNIRAIVRTNENNRYDVLVEAHREEEAIDIINRNTEWIKIGSYNNTLDATFIQTSLSDAGYNAVLVSNNEIFPASTIADLYVIKTQVKDAITFINHLYDRE